MDIFIGKKPEVWVDIINYEGLYQVSNLGRIKRLSRLINVNSNRWGPIKMNDEKIHTAILPSSRYLNVSLCKNGKPKLFQVHRLVAQHFIPNPENKSQVNHKNLNKRDNRVINLEWATSKENMNHAYANKRHEMIKNRVKDQSHYKSKDVLTYAGFVVNIKQAAKMQGVSQAHMSRMLNGNRINTTSFQFV